MKEKGDNNNKRSGLSKIGICYPETVTSSSYIETLSNLDLEQVFTLPIRVRVGTSARVTETLRLKELPINDENFDQTIQEAIWLFWAVHNEEKRGTKIIFERKDGTKTQIRFLKPEHFQGPHGSK